MIAGVIYTVEGNSGDTVRQNQYLVGGHVILGFGVVEYWWRDEDYRPS